MKILFCLLLLLFCLGNIPAHAGFVIARHNVQPAAIVDSPVVRQAVPRHADPRMRKTSTKQVNSYCVLALIAGLLAISGAIALLLLWPVSVGVGVALGLGTLITGIAAVVFWDLDGQNIKPHSGLSFPGGILGLIAILPVLIPVSICVTIYFLIHDLFVIRRKRRRRFSGV